MGVLRIVGVRHTSCSPPFFHPFFSYLTLNLHRLISHAPLKPRFRPSPPQPRSHRNSLAFSFTENGNNAPCWETQRSRQRASSRESCVGEKRRGFLLVLELQLQWVGGQGIGELPATPSCPHSRFSMDQSFSGHMPGHALSP